MLKDEIIRLAKKTTKQAVGALHTQSARHRRDLAQLKRSLAEIERGLRVARKQAPRVASRPAENEARTSHRFQAKGLRTLRARLGLSAADFGKLAGVSGQTIYSWEREKSVPRRAQVVALAPLRSLGKRQAAEKLASLA